MSPTTITHLGFFPWRPVWFHKRILQIHIPSARPPAHCQAKRRITLAKESEAGGWQQAYLCGVPMRNHPPRSFLQARKT